MTTTKTAATVLDHLYELSKKIINGATLDECLDLMFTTFDDVVPYDRIGFADIDSERQTVTARWMRSHLPVYLLAGYSAPLAESSLALVVERGVPRVMNDLPGYLAKKPASKSTRLVVCEGINSSLTCPLFVKEGPIGFLFFSSRHADAYDERHVKILKEVANHLAFLLVLAKETENGRNRRQSQPQSPTSHADSQKNSLYDLQPGIVLEEPLKLDNGRLLLGAGVVLTSDHLHRIRRLHDQGFLRVTPLVVGQEERE